MESARLRAGSRSGSCAAETRGRAWGLPRSGAARHDSACVRPDPFRPAARLLRMVCACGVLQRDVPALALVAVQHVLPGLSAQDLHEFLRQVERIVDAAVHAHGPDRAVHMGAIAGEDRATDAEFLRHALVDRVEVAGDDVERLPVGKKRCSRACNASGRVSAFPSVLGLDRENARASGRADLSSGTGSTIRPDRRCSSARYSRVCGNRRRLRCSRCDRDR